MENKIRKIRNGGRPKMKAEDKKSVVITFRADRITRLILDEKVKEAKQTMSDFLREAISNCQISMADIDDCLREIDRFNSATFLEYLIVSTTVIQPFSLEEIQTLRSLYDFTNHIELFAQKASEQLSDTPTSTLIDINYKLARIADEFNEIKDYFINKVLGIKQ